MLTINELTNGSCSISSPTNLNVIVGRNGSGKSRFLRTLAGLKNNSEYYISYISPERAGSFLVDPGVEHNRQHDKNWESNNRLKNQSDGFKKTSASKLRELAMQFAVRIENDPSLRSQLIAYLTISDWKDMAHKSSDLLQIMGMRFTPIQLVAGNQKQFRLEQKFFIFLNNVALKKLMFYF